MVDEAFRGAGGQGDGLCTGDMIIYINFGLLKQVNEDRMR